MDALDSQIWHTIILKKHLQVVLCILQRQGILGKTHNNSTSREGGEELYLHVSILAVTPKN
jgi:hypothetical protein